AYPVGKTVGGGRAVDSEAVGGAQTGEIDVTKPRGLAEDDVGGAGVRTPARIRRGRADDEVVEAVTVEITGGRAGKPGFGIPRSADDAKAVARGQVGQVDIGQAAGLAEDHIGGAGLLPPVRAFDRRADDEVGEPVAVDVPGGSDRKSAFARFGSVDTDSLA